MNILDTIIENKKEEVHRQKKAVPVTRLIDLSQNLPAPRSFCNCLDAQTTVAIIAEIKRASPSAGLLRADFDPVFIAQSYEKNGASALSILTDERFFKGKLEYINHVRQHVEIPILRKDFIIDPYQVVEARAFGADVILLIMGALSKAQCLELVATAHELNLGTLVEVHCREELNTALSCDFRVIGINNRNLRTLEVDLNTTERLLAHIPGQVKVVSESGIKNKKEIERLGQLGVDAVLIGESLMRQSDIGAALKQFVGVPKWSR